MSKSLIIIFCILSLSFALVGNFVLAEVMNPTQETEMDPIDETTMNPPQIENRAQTAELDNPLGTAKTVPAVIGRIIKAFLGIVGSISLIIFIYAGITLITAAGKTSQIQQGKETMLWAALGIIIVLAAYAVLKFVMSAFGLS